LLTLELLEDRIGVLSTDLKQGCLEWTAIDVALSVESADYLCISYEATDTPIDFDYATVNSEQEPNSYSVLSRSVTCCAEQARPTGLFDPLQQDVLAQALRNGSFVCCMFGNAYDGDVSSDDWRQTIREELDSTTRIITWENLSKESGTLATTEPVTPQTVIFCGGTHQSQTAAKYERDATDGQLEDYPQTGSDQEDAQFSITTYLHIALPTVSVDTLGLAWNIWQTDVEITSHCRLDESSDSSPMHCRFSVSSSADTPAIGKWTTTTTAAMTGRLTTSLRRRELSDRTCTCLDVW